MCEFLLKSINVVQILSILIERLLFGIGKTVLLLRCAKSGFEGYEKPVSHEFRLHRYILQTERPIFCIQPGGDQFYNGQIGMENVRKSSIPIPE